MVVMLKETQSYWKIEKDGDNIRGLSAAVIDGQFHYIQSNMSASSEGHTKKWTT